MVEELNCFSYEERVTYLEYRKMVMGEVGENVPVACSYEWCSESECRMVL